MTEADPRYPEGPDGPSVYELAGGTEAFVALVDAFYERVEADELLRPMYPDDLAPGKRALALFLAQYWGGPRTYDEERGHPMLRRRHMPFPITQTAALHWAHHMADAIRGMRFHSHVEDALLGYVGRFTPAMVNTDETPPPEHLLPRSDG